MSETSGETGSKIRPSGSSAALWCVVRPQDGPVGQHREKDDGVLLVVTAQLYGKKCRALVDSGATRSFIMPTAVL